MGWGRWGGVSRVGRVDIDSLGVALASTVIILMYQLSISYKETMGNSMS